MCGRCILLLPLRPLLKLHYLLACHAELLAQPLYLYCVLILLDHTFKSLALAILDPLHASELLLEP